MKTYHCDGCGSLVFFDNTSCVQCGHALGFLPELGVLSALEPSDNGTWEALTSRAKGRWYRQCSNGAKHQVCNWMIPSGDPDAFCLSCRLDEIIPDLTVSGNLERWRKIEMAKRRVIYTILQLRLPTEAVPEENRPGLRFKFLGDVEGGPPVTTGHENGLITINIAEADDDKRERRRVSLHEPYRTLLGHLRHETAHYYWDRLIANSRWLESWRAQFGDESLDYGTALQAYYDKGPPSDWQIHSVSAYASAHPWEDWAETWAHYFHIIDSLETAASFGMALKPRHPAANSMTTDLKTIRVFDSSFDTLLERWFPLTYALNSLNRGMGLHDLYPFALSTQAIEKLRFVHEVVQASHSNTQVVESNLANS